MSDSPSALLGRRNMSASVSWSMRDFPDPSWRLIAHGRLVTRAVFF
jgi:hypothetical protein